MDEQVLDLKEFLERVQDDKELLLELLDIYVEDFRAKRKLFEDAAAQKNFDELKNISHSLKGASGNISAKILRELFLKLEDSAKNNDISVVAGLLPAVDKNFDQLLVRIESVKKELGKN